MFGFSKKRPSDPIEERPDADRLERRLAALRASNQAALELAAEIPVRKSNRVRTRKLGSVLIGKSAPLACLVTDVSPNGMKIFLYDEAELPGQFRLSVEPLEFDQEVTLAWQEGKDAGVTWQSSAEEGEAGAQAGASSRR